jgi:DNA polymerase V
MDDLQTMANSDGVSTHRGFPNPALERRAPGDQNLALDLNRLLIRQSSSTYLFRIAGHHWADQGIYDGDIAVIDRAVQAGSSDLLIAWGDEGMNLCRQHQLTPDHTPWGVVTAIIHQYR